MTKQNKNVIISYRVKTVTYHTIKKSYATKNYEKKDLKFTDSITDSNAIPSNNYPSSVSNEHITINT